MDILLIEGTCFFYFIDIQTTTSYSFVSIKIGGIMQTTISTKFQVVIPKPTRERLKLKPKQKLTVIEKDGMLILIPQTTIESLRGIAAGAQIDDYREKKDRMG
ncbi:AbrB/MazE/SpoVT family DNA-binding domain-containing protein [Desulfosarcina cetonica]|uniref:AbrB/MazE/SpoVT family DNA-binding domain-containing protein n=1 Tax=Desulfosarcina cetonica TaxID=90730 RepID=UPI001FEFE1AA|nr:AbrB/MazE/SpoVT family DNA-binding domain-containing protein [Desulfosarcina cetonica]